MTKPIRKDNKYGQLTTEELRDKVIRYLVTGHSMEQISEKLNTDVELVVKTWKDYVSTQYAMPEEERWLLHERRLEYLLQKAANLIEQGLDDEFGPKALEAALKILTNLEELQGLNNSRKKEAENRVVELTQKQVTQMLGILDAVKNELANHLPAMIQAQTKKYWTPDTIQGEFEDVQLKVLEAHVG